MSSRLVIFLFMKIVNLNVGKKIQKKKKKITKVHAKCFFCVRNIFFNVLIHPG